MRHVRAIVLFGAVLLVVGCANVPEESQPQVVGPAGGAEQQAPVPQPKSGIAPITVVRNFVEASGRPLDSHALARVYLAPQANKRWRPSGAITIVNDSFNAVPAPSDEQPEAENERVVLVTGTTAGKLTADNAFIPENTDERLRIPVRLRRQQNGQWRIIGPPNRIIITKSSFNEHYFRVAVRFFAKDSATLVPDLRYVAAAPSDGLPSKVVDLLIDGPSKGLAGAVRNPLGGKVGLESNVRVASDGALVVPLTGVRNKSRQEKELIVAQLVKSLQSLPISQFRPQAGDAPLIEGNPTWRSSELPAYSASAELSSELSGLFVYNGRVRKLADGTPVAGAAGSGFYEVLSAAQSIGGGQLAVVERFDGGARLRVGPVDGSLQAVDLAGASMTAPTWRPSSSADSPSSTVWTVVDGERVAKVQRNPQGGWSSQAVDASAITSIGEITALRLSRDGARVAAIVGGNLVIAAVVRESNSITLSAPRVLQSDTLTDVIDVAWSGQHNVVAATSSASSPVVRLPVDGLRLQSYNTSNLTTPVRAIAAAPGRPVVVADQVRMNTASDVGEIWRPHPQSRPGAIPFYPG